MEKELWTGLRAFCEGIVVMNMNSISNIGYTIFMELDREVIRWLA